MTPHFDQVPSCIAYTPFRPSLHVLRLLNQPSTPKVSRYPRPVYEHTFSPTLFRLPRFLFLRLENPDFLSRTNRRSVFYEAISLFGGKIITSSNQSTLFLFGISFVDLFQSSSHIPFLLILFLLPLSSWGHVLFVPETVLPAFWDGGLFETDGEQCTISLAVVFLLM